jgi:hypothetical protein
LNGALLPPAARLGLLALVALGVLATAAAALAGAQGLYPGILVAFLFLLGLGLGGTLILAMNAAVGARWHTLFRKVLEAVAATLPLGAAMVLLMLWAASHIYPWARPGFMDNPIPQLAGKKGWLSLGYFSLRSLVYVALWTGFGGYLLGQYRAQERDGVSRVGRIRRASMGFLILFAYTFSLSSFDWVMSLEPVFYSTIFGVYCFAGIMQSGFAVVILLVLYLDSKGVFKGGLRQEHLHDLGKWLFAFSCFWAYIWFFQYMLIWYADLPDENQYYLLRGGHRAIMMGLVVTLSFGVPFFGLASQKVKKHRSVLAAVAAIVVLAHWMDLVLMVQPSQGTMANPFAVVLPLAAGAAFVLLFFRAFERHEAVPKPDAALAYSKHYRV